MIIHVPVVSRKECESGQSAAVYIKDKYHYVMRRYRDRFPWEHRLGKDFDRKTRDEQVDLFLDWKRDYPERWDELCQKWHFDKSDDTPWIHYELQADSVEEEWTTIEGA